MASRIAILVLFVPLSFAEARSYAGLGIGVTQSIHVGLALMQKDARTNLDVGAALNEVGYRKIAALKMNDMMGTFIARVISHLGGTVTSPADLEGFVPFYSGATDIQSYDQLVRELSKAPWVNWGNRSLKLFGALKRAGAAPGAVSQLDEHSFKRVAQKDCDVQLNMFIRRLIAARNATIINETGFESVVPYYSGIKALGSYDALLAELHEADWVQHNASSNASFSVETPLSEEGYKSVSELGDEKAMELFIRRVITSVNATVRSGTVMQNLASFHSVAGTTYAQLLKDLSSASWLADFWVPLTTSDLNEQGYQDIAKLHKNGEMGRFARLILESRGGSIKNMSAFESVIPQFSGKLRVQNFSALEDALHHATFVDWTA